MRSQTAEQQTIEVKLDRAAAHIGDALALIEEVQEEENVGTSVPGTDIVYYALHAAKTALVGEMERRRHLRAIDESKMCEWENDGIRGCTRTATALVRAANVRFGIRLCEKHAKQMEAEAKVPLCVSWHPAEHNVPREARPF